jgi:hypothetical protein
LRSREAVERGVGVSLTRTKERKDCNGVIGKKLKKLMCFATGRAEIWRRREEG